MRASHGFLLALSVASSGCMTTVLQADFPPTTQLEIRAIQSRTYAGQEVRAVLRAVLNVLQDDGFLVHYGSADLGLLHARKAAAAFDTGPFRLPLSVDAGIATIRATTNVSEFGDGVRVRINFERKVVDAWGRVVRVAPVTEAKRYQEFFARLDRGLFLQREGL